MPTTSHTVLGINNPKSNICIRFEYISGVTENRTLYWINDVNVQMFFVTDTMLQKEKKNETCDARAVIDYCWYDSKCVHDSLQSTYLSDGVSQSGFRINGCTTLMDFQRRHGACEAFISCTWNMISSFDICHMCVSVQVCMRARLYYILSNHLHICQAARINHTRRAKSRHKTSSHKKKSFFILARATQVPVARGKKILAQANIDIKTGAQQLKIQRSSIPAIF